MNQKTLDKACIYLLQKGIKIDGLSSIECLELAIETFLKPGGDRSQALVARLNANE